MIFIFDKFRWYVVTIANKRVILRSGVAFSAHNEYFIAKLVFSNILVFSPSKRARNLQLKRMFYSLNFELVANRVDFPKFSGQFWQFCENFWPSPSTVADKRDRFSYFRCLQIMIYYNS